MVDAYEHCADMDAEDRGRWQLHNAKMDAIKINPSQWNRQEILDACMEEILLYHEFSERYAPTDTRDWIVTRTTGRILYEVK